MKRIINFIRLTPKVIVVSFQVLISLTFFVSFLGKILDPFDFLVFMIKLGIPQSFLMTIYYSLIAIEIYISILFAVGGFLRKASIIVLLLFIVFILVIAYSMVNGLVANCGCFGNILESSTGFWSLMRNLFLFILALVTYFNFEKGYKIRIFGNE